MLNRNFNISYYSYMNSYNVSYKFLTSTISLKPLQSPKETLLIKITNILSNVNLTQHAQPMINT